MEQLLIIGAGVIGRHHADALAVIPGGDRCALLVFDPNAEARAAFARDYPRAELFEDLGAAMARGGGPRDIAIVATPPAPRFQIMERCLQSGWHVLAEKPFTMDAEQARQAVAWAEASGRLLSCCDSRFLGQACIEKARAIWDSGRLGSCYRLVWRHRQGRSRSGVEWQPESPWFLQKAKNGGGVVMDWAPYDLATIHELLRPTAVRIQAAWLAAPEAALPAGVSPRPMDVEFHAGARLNYSTAHGDLLVEYERSSCLHGPTAAEFLLEGNRGTAECDWTFEPSLAIHFDIGGIPQIERVPVPDDGLHCHHRPLNHLREAVAGRPSAATLGDQARFNLAVLRAIYAVAADGIPREESLDATQLQEAYP